MKTIRKPVGIMLSLFMLIGMFMSISFTAYAETYSGNAGNNINWSINTESGEMSVTGIGDMNDEYTEWQYTPYSVKYRYYVKTASVQEGITSIGNNAFCCFENLEQVTIPSTAEKIGYYAFNNCFILKTISAPSAKFIDNHAFYQCYALKEIELGEELERINAYAFGRCSSLEHIYLPKSISIIEQYAFSECDSLTDVYYGGSKADWDKIFINYGNDNLLNANIHFEENSESENLIQIRNGDCIYFDNSSLHWSNVYCYVWGDTSSFIQWNGWPGKLMTEVSDDVFGIEIYDDNYLLEKSTPYTKVIFSNGSDEQSTDLYFAGESKIAIPNIAEHKFTVNWLPYSGVSVATPTNPTTDTSIKFNSDNLKGYVYDTVKTTIVLDSDKYNIGDLDIKSSNSSVAEIDVISIGEGNYITQGNEKIATLYIKLKSEGTSAITATAPDKTTSSLNIVVEDYEHFDYGSGFTLGRDNNAFFHYNFEYEAENGKTPAPGFLGVSNYSIPTNYYKNLSKNATFSEKAKIIKASKTQWGGSCYGIASTMCLNYSGDINLYAFFNGASNYRQFGLPFVTTDFLNTITYYQLSQQIENNGTKHAYYYCDLNNASPSSITKSSFLRKMVDICSNKETAVFGMKVGTSGHAIVACGYHYDATNKLHIIRLYDENSVVWQEDIGTYAYMFISNDYNDFEIKGDVSEDTSKLDAMWLVDITGNSSLADPTIFAKGEFLTATNKKMYLTVNMGVPFEITNENGERLIYDGKYYTGDMKIYDIKPIFNDSNSQVVYELDYCDNLMYSSSNKSIEIDVYDDENYYSLSGENIELVNASITDGLNIKGDNYSFSTRIGRESSDDVEVVSIEGKGTNNVSIYKNKNNNVNVISDETIKDVSVEISSINTDELVIDEEELTKFTLKDNNEIINNDNNNTKPYIFGDVNGDGKVSILDATEIQKHLAELSSLNTNQLSVADVNGDGKISILDATQIQKYLAELIPSLG